MFSQPQYTTPELQQYDYFVMQEPVWEEKIEEPVFMCAYEENEVLYCASSTSQEDYYYSYVLNNPLTFTDPSGYYMVPPIPRKKNRTPSKIPYIDFFEPYEPGQVNTGLLFDQQWSYLTGTEGSGWVNNFEVTTYYPVMTSGVGLDPLLVGFLVSIGGDLSGIWFNDNLHLGSASLDGLGPEFSGSIGDWVNKINHLGNRKWTDPETGTSYYINDNGQITGYYPVTGIAPSPGKGSKFALQLSKQLAKDGPKSIIKSYISTQKRLLEHQAKLPGLQYTSSVEREIRTFQTQLEILEEFMKKHGIIF